MWVNAFFTSSNAKIVVGYYLDVIEHFTRCPKIIRTDEGTENVVLRRTQTFLRRHGTDRHAGELSAQRGRSTANQRIQQLRSTMRRQCTQFWIEIMKHMTF